MIELKNIWKAYISKKGEKCTALKDISLKLPEKGMVFILGKSGSGKSTLLNIIGGLDFADHGEIVVAGKSSKNFKQKDYDGYRNTYAGFIFQEYNLMENLSVRHNLMLPLQLQNKKGNDAKIKEVLTSVELEGYEGRLPAELSGGQKQRITIARALIKNPKMILADEPTGNLDSKTGEGIFKLLKKLSLQKLVLIVTHDREAAETYGDRVIEIADGIIFSDTKAFGCIENNEKLSFIKSHMPNKYAFKMGAGNLSNKKFRLSISVILSAAALVFLSISILFSAFSPERAIINNTKNEKPFYSILQSSLYDDNKIILPADYVLPNYINRNIISYLDKNHKLKYLPQYAFDNKLFAVETIGLINPIPNLLTVVNSVHDISNIDLDLYENSKELNRESVYISDCFADFIIQNKDKYIYENKDADIPDLIGQEIKSIYAGSGPSFRIAGIFKTDYKYDYNEIRAGRAYIGMTCPQF